MAKTCATFHANLQENEQEALLDCGCRLKRNGTDVELWHCPLHGSAGAMKTVLLLAERNLEMANQWADEMGKVTSIDSALAQVREVLKKVVEGSDQ